MFAGEVWARGERGGWLAFVAAIGEGAFGRRSRCVSSRSRSFEGNVGGWRRWRPRVSACGRRREHEGRKTGGLRWTEC